MNNDCFDIAIIGGGPAGYEAALAAGKYGLKSLLVEGKSIGGTCLNVGCIPTKTYLHKAKTYDLIRKNINTSPELSEFSSLKNIKNSAQRVIKRMQLGMETSLKANNVVYVKENVVGFDAATLITDQKNKFWFKNLIIATGTRPFIPEPLMNNNFYTNENIFELEELPASISIIGGGAIGVEFAFFFSLLNVPVTLYETAPSILAYFDNDLIEEVRKLLKRQKVKILENTTPDMASLKKGIVLVATGRKAWFPETRLNLKLTTRGYIKTNANFQTDTQNIFAIGDVNGLSLLAHSAADQGHQVLNYIAKKTVPKNKVIPGVIYTSPSITTIGLREKDITQKNLYKIIKINFGLSGKSQAEDQTNGWVKVITQKNILKGCQIFGHNSEDLIPLCSLAVEKEVPLEQFAELIYPHPSYCEVLRDAFQKALEI
ncbi:MAG: NAD(P)/FAD-dependent oxidoreductase [Candidatus Margulisbacteria bacterium]|nr:NAD(P)/FAD-dependent oxidoreductase [Candidatus Margulisiibacteriota bacterium]